MRYDWKRSIEPDTQPPGISPDINRDLGEVGISTPEFDRYVVPILKPYSSGGYYFRFDDLGQPELKATIQKQAHQLGFSSQSIKLKSKVIRVWLNREYCMTSV